MVLDKEKLAAHQALLQLRQDREEANKAVSFAMWSYLGLALPLIGWILAGYSLSLVKYLPHEGIIERKIRTAKFHSRMSLTLSLAIVVAWTGLYFYVASETQRQVTLRQQQEAAQAQATKDEEQRKQFLKQTNLTTCLNATDKAYWDYVKLNATSVTQTSDGPVYRAYQTTWDAAENARKNAKDDCYKEASLAN